MQKNTVMKYLNVDCISVICSFLDINKDTYILDSFSLLEKEKDRVLNYWKNHSKYTIKETEQRKEWLRNGILHREGGLPTIEWSDGMNEWYVRLIIFMLFYFHTVFCQSCYFSYNFHLTFCQ